ncbi:hypothetical protein [Streptomyces lancefieldiae]|uniref:Mannose-1-phosphate guanylyltransferase (GDP) n=1 Tax=Streptomyces lancefieldiae TaxID=3075520 RepID=A0ABU3AZQ8_9ACTN|nr:hypothetical protein [Streptomyces sp. DSM 40712]MDT0615686.1 hypothetical protein [Streptomyces sp. DSM 40712]
MHHHAENGADHVTDDAAQTAEEPELYEDDAWSDEVGEAYDDGRAETLGDEGPHGGTVGQDDDAPAERPAEDRDPDVYLDVPQLKVDEITLDVEDLRARVSLQAEVLDLLRLNVGADVALGQVHLGISGVEAQAQLKVRLDNVALIINRVLTTIDRNPQILEQLARGVGSAVQEVGRGTGSAVEDVGEGAGYAVRDVGEGAGSAVRDVGGGAGEAVGEVGHGVGEAVEDVGGGAGGAVGEAGGAAGRAVEGVGDAARETGRAAGRTAEAVGAGETVGKAEKATRRAGPTGDGAEGTGSGRSATRRRRTRDDESKATRPTRRRGAEKREEPP